MSRLVKVGTQTALPLLAQTWRWEHCGREYVDELRRDRAPFVFALWHAHILPLIWFHRGDPTALVISRHRDGRYLAVAAQEWGFGVIDGSSTHGSLSALRRMIRTLREGGEVAVTPDGPRGPARQAKPGTVAAAQSADVPILPVRASVLWAWRLRSWDGFVVPAPFARVRISYERPIRVASGRAGRERAGLQLQASLERAWSPW